MKSLAANLFLVSLFRISISVFILNPSTNIVVEPLAEPIIHGEKAIHAIVPAPEGYNVGDIIVIKNEFQNYDERFSIELAIIITDKSLTRKMKNSNPLNIMDIIYIPIQEDTVELLLMEKFIEYYINIKHNVIRYQTEICFLFVEPVIYASE